MNLRVETIDGNFEVSPEETFTFGRSSSCSFCVDPADINISRTAGVIAFDGLRWVLTNASTSRSLFLLDEDFGIRHHLLPGRGHLVYERNLRVCLEGTGRSYFEFNIVPPLISPQFLEPAPSGPITLVPPPLTDRQRLDLAALLWDYHAPDGRREPKPRPYSQAAAHLGCTAKALERRISELRGKLSKIYSSLNGPTGNEALARLMLTTGALQAADFERLRDLVPS